MNIEIQELKQRLNLITIVALTHKLKRVGKEIFCCCPFHEEHTPSCIIHSNFYKCFACGASGDALSWIQHVNKCNFKKAVKFAAKFSGVIIDHKSYDSTSSANGFHYGDINTDCDIRFDCISFGPSIINKFSIGDEDFRIAVNKFDSEKKAVTDAINNTTDELTLEYLKSYLKDVKIKTHSFISKTLKTSGEWEKFCKLKLDSGVSLYCKIHKSGYGIVVSALNDEFAIQTLYKEEVLALIQEWALEWGLSVRFIKK